MSETTYEWTTLKPYVAEGYADGRPLPVISEDEPLRDDIITQLECGLSATDGTVTVYISAIVDLPPPIKDSFTPLQDLSEDWVLEIAERVSEERSFKHTLNARLEAVKSFSNVVRGKPVEAKQFSWQDD